MKKILSLGLVLFLTLAGCTTKKSNKTKTKSKTTTKWVANAINRVGYITESNESKDYNYIRQVVEDSQKEYGYRLDGSADLAYRMTYGTTRTYSADSPKEFLSALERLDDNRVGLLFIENAKVFNQLLSSKTKEINLWDEVTKRKVYKGHMVIIGDESQYYLKKDLKVGKGKEKWEWKSDKIATFEFSEIVSAYNIGYRTQYTFGKTADGTKKTVGYMLGATYELAINREKNMRKAIAFRQGILDAVKEQETGEATFASKTSASKNKDEQNLVRSLSSLEEIVPNLVKDVKYKDKDHSITYFAGATAEYNETIASYLMKQKVRNAYGHKLVGEYASTTIGDLFDASRDLNYMKAFKTDDEGEEVHLPKQSVTGRIAMFYNKDNKAYRKADYTKKKASEKIIKMIMNDIFKKDVLNDYFGKHSYFGTFGLIYSPGSREVPKNAQVSKSMPEELKNKLWNKKITEDMFKDKTFLGWSE